MSSRPMLLRCVVTMVSAAGLAACGGAERQFSDGTDDAAASGGDATMMGDGNASMDVKAETAAGDAHVDAHVIDVKVDSPSTIDAPVEAQPDVFIDVPPEAQVICTAGMYRCTGAALELCGAGGLAWTTQATCLSDALCDAAAGQCITPTCAIGDTQCVGAEHQTCAQDRKGWTADNTCATAALCSAAGCAQPACAAGAYTCSRSHVAGL